MYTNTTGHAMAGFCLLKVTLYHFARVPILVSKSKNRFGCLECVVSCSAQQYLLSAFSTGYTCKHTHFNEIHSAFAINYNHHSGNNSTKLHCNRFENCLMSKQQNTLQYPYIHYKPHPSSQMTITYVRYSSHGHTKTVYLLNRQYFVHSLIFKANSQFAIYDTWKAISLFCFFENPC